MNTNKPDVTTTLTLTGDADAILEAIEAWKKSGVSVNKLSEPKDLLANALSEEQVEVKLSLHGGQEAIYGKPFDILERASVRRHTSSLDGMKMNHTSY